MHRHRNFPRCMTKERPREAEDYVHILACILCGDRFGNPEMPWRHYFRALYQASDLVGVSEIGLWSSHVPLKVPADQDAEWDTMGEDYVILSDLSCWPRDLFLFHELCWRRLVKHIATDDIDCSDLYIVLKRLPSPSKPGPSGYFGSDFERYETPPLRYLLQSERDRPRCAAELQTTLTRNCNPTDGFRRLPLEIIEALGALLSTRDVLNSRLASRAMGLLFHSPTFWKTWFEINGERGFLNYLIKRGRKIDWRLLFHSTCTMRCGRSFELTIRAWESNRWVRDALLCKPRVPFMDFGGRALQHYHNTAWPGIYRRSISIPPDLMIIGVSVLQEIGDDLICIKGLELIRADGSSVLLGSKIAGAQVISEDLPELLDAPTGWFGSSYSYAYPGIQMLLNARGLQGFFISTAITGGVGRLQLIRRGGWSVPVGYNYGEGFTSHALMQLGIRGFGSNQKTREWDRDGYYPPYWT
ncbi:hypothetical protein BO94DRAFT_617728 [Aspergillus sclerotioniger CBS 115572]|uniref:F-box domain-containing protein n=1 Tax=Aspergillus sclerotioniger CBS 115572 TaxID=1450535 RepID=A0A317X092_9EURO|nr:hypothetical protein BO94DRAFT_617728 [Aspergillus sclerotioniger CBS 115572]PWY91973.1 hypothetical protein BO94DRAFT_617728 [Aspergillus sclerotioniger CBS 115572]